MIGHLETDILKCEVKEALGIITVNKAKGGDGIPAALFQILKDDAVKVLHLNMSANLENSVMATGLEKTSFIPIPKKGNAIEYTSYCTITFISHANKLILKILQARLQ